MFSYSSSAVRNTQQMELIFNTEAVTSAYGAQLSSRNTPNHTFFTLSSDNSSTSIRLSQNLPNKKKQRKIIKSETEKHQIQINLNIKEKKVQNEVKKL